MTRSKYLAVIAAIEDLVSGDDCAEWEMRLAAGRLEGETVEMQRVIAQVYRLAHAFNPNHSCYRSHDSWRSALPTKVAS